MEPSSSAARLLQVLLAVVLSLTLSLLFGCADAAVCPLPPVSNGVYALDESSHSGNMNVLSISHPLEDVRACDRPLTRQPYVYVTV